MPIVVKPPPIATTYHDPIDIIGEAASPGEASRLQSRRTFLRRSGMLTAAAVLTPAVFAERGWSTAAYAAGPDLVTDTFNGLVAFIVPGPDAYSLQQQVRTATPGGIAASATDAVIFSLDFIQLAPPPFAKFSELVAFILNNLAQTVHPPTPPGPFTSPFANLLFAEKAAVFAIMEGGLAGPQLVPLGGALPFFVGFTAYSEVGVFDPETRTLTGVPVGWTLSNYDGVADGRDDFLGYFENRRQAL
jgi:hypothetical protein